MSDLRSVNFAIASMTSRESTTRRLIFSAFMKFEADILKRSIPVPPVVVRSPLWPLGRNSRDEERPAEGLSRASLSKTAVALESARLIPALILLFFLPGWTLINALFPRKGDLDREYDVLYRITLGIVMSVVVVILFGFVL